MSSNDDGWLVGGGEPGPPKSYKLASKDSAHVEIMRIGTYNPEWGRHSGGNCGRNQLGEDSHTRN